MGSQIEDLNLRETKSESSAVNSDLSLLGQSHGVSLKTVDAVFRGNVDNSTLPSLSFNDEIAKQENATTMKTRTDAQGSAHTDYYLGQHKVFEDVHNQNGDRTRVSYDMLGRVEGKRTDYADGRSSSEFKGDFGTYRVTRDHGKLSVQKQGMDGWEKVEDQSECTDILRQEKQIFSPPHVVGRGA